MGLRIMTSIYSIYTIFQHLAILDFSKQIFPFKKGLPAHLIRMKVTLYALSEHQAEFKFRLTSQDILIYLNCPKAP